MKLRDLWSVSISLRKQKDDGSFDDKTVSANLVHDGDQPEDGVNAYKLFHAMIQTQHPGYQTRMDYVRLLGKVFDFTANDPAPDNDAVTA